MRAYKSTWREVFRTPLRPALVATGATTPGHPDRRPRFYHRWAGCSKEMIRAGLGILIRVPSSCMSKVQLRRRIQFSSLLVKSFVIIRRHAVALDIYGRHG